MLGRNISLLCDILDTPDLSGEPLTMVPTDELLSAASYPSLNSRAKNKVVAEILCRIVGNPVGSEEKISVIAERIGAAVEAARRFVECLHRYENVFEQSVDESYAKECVQRAVEENLGKKDVADDVLCEIQERQIRHWSNDGFVPVFPRDSMYGNGVLIPFKFEPLSKGVRIVYQDGAIHNEWTSAFETLAGIAGVEGVEIRLGVKDMGTNGLGEESFMLPMLLAWWRRQRDKKIKYNPFRVFATGRFRDGRLSEVKVGPKRTLIEKSVAGSLLICPATNGTFGEIGQSHFSSLESVHNAIADILRNCSAADFANIANSIWGRRVVGRLLTINENVKDAFLLVRTNASCGDGIANERAILSAFGAVCALLNSPNGGIVLLGLHMTGGKVIPAQISSMRFEGRVPRYNYTNGEWETGDFADNYLRAAQDRISRGWPISGSDGCFEKWKIQASDDKDIDIHDYVIADVDEFVGRPVLKLIVRPYRQPVVMHREFYFGKVFSTWSNHICGGNGPSVIPDAHEWRPIDLTRYWRTDSDSQQFKKLLDRERKHEREIKDDRLYAEGEKIRRRLIGALVRRLGCERPRRVIYSLGGVPFLRMLCKECWLYESGDEITVRTMFENVALILLQLHQCDDRPMPLPLSLSTTDFIGNDIFVALHHALAASVPRLVMTVNQFRHAILTGRYLLILDLSRLSLEWCLKSGMMTTFRNLRNLGTVRYVLFCKRGLMAAETALREISQKQITDFISSCSISSCNGKEDKYEHPL